MYITVRHFLDYHAHRLRPRLNRIMNVRMKQVADAECEVNFVLLMANWQNNIELHILSKQFVVHTIAK